MCMCVYIYIHMYRTWARGLTGPLLPPRWWAPSQMMYCFQSKHAKVTWQVALVHRRRVPSAVWEIPRLAGWALG